MSNRILFNINIFIYFQKTKKHFLILIQEYHITYNYYYNMNSNKGYLYRLGLEKYMKNIFGELFLS